MREPFKEQLAKYLTNDSAKPVKQRRLAQLLFEELPREGFGGGYDFNFAASRKHPENLGKSLAEVFADERAHLISVKMSFVGYQEASARVSVTSPMNFEGFVLSQIALRLSCCWSEINVSKVEIFSA